MRNGFEWVHVIKKPGEAEGNDARSKTSAEDKGLTLDDIILAGLERGLSMDDIRKMQLGRVVDFVIAYNERQKQSEKAQNQAERRANKRKATQNDIDSFFG